MTQYAQLGGNWMAIPDSWVPFLPSGTPTSPTAPPKDAAPSGTDNILNTFQNMVGAQGRLDQPVAGPPIHWTPGPAPFVPFMQQAAMPQGGIDIQRFMSPQQGALWGQLPQPGPGTGVPNPWSPYGPGTEPLQPQMPQPQMPFTPIVPPPGMMPLPQPTTTWTPAPAGPAPTLAPWTDVSMLPQSPSGSMAGWGSGGAGALY